jgi:hypothetical protein
MVLSTISFRCSSCGKEHRGMPTFGFDFPIQYLDIPDGERSERVLLTSDTCTIDGQYFYVRGSLEIPVRGSDVPFAWGVWVSLSEKNFFHFQDLLHVEERSQHGPFFGWLSSPPKPYPDSTNLKTMVHLRDHGVRPYIELEPTDHPLAVEQREGITMDRVAEIYELVVHHTRRAG